MTNEELNELERLAKAATEGEWIESDHDVYVLDMYDDANEGEPICFPSTANPNFKNNMKFIAKSNPQTALSLIAEVRRLRELVEQARKKWNEEQKR